MSDKTIAPVSKKFSHQNLYDAVVGDEIIRDVPSKMIYVSSRADLAKITGEMPGTCAITYGMETMWQLLPNGTWKEV